MINYVIETNSIKAAEKHFVYLLKKGNFLFAVVLMEINFSLWSPLLVNIFHYYNEIYALYILKL